jgi:prepilin-type N-terminal cleavage/methylation domain-containing protein
MNRRGFSFIELLVAMTIIGILANIAIPIIRNVKVKAEATQIIGDINVIRTAAYDYYAAHQAFPEGGAWGTPPRAMVPSLPNGFSFRRGDTQYVWIGLNETQSRVLGRTAIIGAQVARPELLNAVKGSYRGDWIFGLGNLLIVFLD